MNIAYCTFECLERKVSPYFGPDHPSSVMSMSALVEISKEFSFLARGAQQFTANCPLLLWVTWDTFRFLLTLASDTVNREQMNYTRYCESCMSAFSMLFSFISNLSSPQQYNSLIAIADTIQNDATLILDRPCGKV